MPFVEVKSELVAANAPKVCPKDTKSNAAIKVTAGYGVELKFVAGKAETKNDKKDVEVSLVIGAWPLGNLVCWGVDLPGPKSTSPALAAKTAEHRQRHHQHQNRSRRDSFARLAGVMLPAHARTLRSAWTRTWCRCQGGVQVRLTCSVAWSTRVRIHVWSKGILAHVFLRRSVKLQRASPRQASVPTIPRKSRQDLRLLIMVNVISSLEVLHIEVHSKART